MSHSPIQIEVLLHHRYSPASWAQARGESPASDAAHEYWLRAQCLRSKAPTNASPCAYELTDKGHAMVALWLRQPLPKVETVYLDGEGKPIDIGEQP